MSANSEENLLSTTQDLTQGTEDPCASLETLVEGNSAKSTDGTLVLLTGMLCKTQNEPQDSLRVTPQRLPIEGEPSKCKQEVVEGVAMAGCMNRMVKMAEPMEIVDINSEKAVLGRELAERACRVDEGDEMNVDINRTAMLGKDPAMMACGVDEGDRMEHRNLWLQQTGFYCEESCQCSRNTTEDIPSTQKLPLMGEWTVCVSSKASNLDIKPVDSLIESKILIVMSIKLEDLHSSGIPHVCLGGMSCHVGDTNCLGNGADASSYQVDGSRGPTDGSEAQMDASDASNGTETAGMSCGNDAGTYLIAGDTKHGVEVMDGVGSHADAPSGDRDILSTQMKAIKPAKVTETICIPQKKPKPPDLPSQSTEWHPDADGCGNHPNMSSVHTDAHCIGNERETAEIETGNIRMG